MTMESVDTDKLWKAVG